MRFQKVFLFGFLLLAGAGSFQVRAQASPARVRVSSGVMAGHLLSKVDPVYPANAKAEHIAGAVVLHAIISEDGMVKDLSVISGPEKLRQSSLDAVRQWIYKPFQLQGKPVEVDTTVTIMFSLSK